MMEFTAVSCGESASLAMPKSRRTARCREPSDDRVTTMFAGLMSRCTTDREWA